MSDFSEELTWYEETELSPVVDDVATKLKQVFNFINFEGTGNLQKHELQIALEDLGMKHDNEFIDKLFNEASSDSGNENNGITFNEFKNICTKKPRDTFGSFAFANIAAYEMKSLGIILPKSFENLDSKFNKPQPPQPPQRNSISSRNSIGGGRGGGRGGGGSLSSRQDYSGKGTKLDSNGTNNNKLSKKRKPASSVSKEDADAVFACFNRLDKDQTGSLEFDEVKLGLMELGMEISDGNVDEMIIEFDDDDDNGTIEFHEFILIYANCEKSDFDWSHIDLETLSKVERHAKGVDNMHEGYNELVAFIRILERGIHFLKVDRIGLPNHLSLKLSPKKDCLRYLDTTGQVASFHLSTIVKIVDAFDDELDEDVLGLVPPNLANLTILIIFAVTPSLEYKRTVLSRIARKTSKGITGTQTTFNTLKIAAKHIDKKKFTELSQTFTQSLNNGVGSSGSGGESTDEIGVHVVDSEKDHIAICSALTAVTNFTEKRLSMRIDFSKRASLSSSSNLSSNKAGGGGGGVPKHTVVPGVLMIVADSIEEKEKTLQGLQQLILHYDHHVLVEEDENDGSGSIDGHKGLSSKRSKKTLVQKKSVQKLVSKKTSKKTLVPKRNKQHMINQDLNSPNSQNSPNLKKPLGESKTMLGSMATMADYIKEASNTILEDIQENASATSTTPTTTVAEREDELGSIGRCFQLFHHLYRPHHHPNHPHARFHLGIEAEVIYDENSYTITGEVTYPKTNQTVYKKLKLPLPVFRPHMYLVAKIVSYDRERGTYDLEYTSGPYVADENPTGRKLFNGPPGSTSVFHIQNVKQSLISVDMYNNFGSHTPYFILLISLIQLVCFISYVIFNNNVNFGLYQPVSGPEWSWLRIISDYPYCDSLQSDWWRYLTYQFVHSGLIHLCFNLIMQLLFGLPLNMVHGSIRFGLIYEFGVVFGALCFVTIDGGYNSVVGCSGGVYCIFGMHLAEIFVNWSLENRGLMNHWTRLLMMFCILGIDAIKIYASPSETTSYSAHAGGLIAGILAGIVFLDTLETTWMSSYIIQPLAFILMILIPLGMIIFYISEEFPPRALGSLFYTDYSLQKPCCWKIFECPSIESSEYDALYCALDNDNTNIQYLFAEKGIDKVITCREMINAVNDYYN